MRCVFKGCEERPLGLTEFCWGHLPDKEGYKALLEHAVREKKDLTGFNLKRAGLSRACLSGAHLFDSNLKGSDLVGADLFNCDLTHCNMRDADLTKANLAGARLWSADLTGANLTECDLSSADLWNARLFGVKLWHAVLTNAKSLSRKNFSDEKGLFKNPCINEAKAALSAEESYRELKKYFTTNGMNDDASWASFKEKTMERLILKKKRDPHYFPSLLMNLLCGYGEKTYRIVLSSVFAISIYGLLYFSLNAIEASGARNQPLTFSDCFYYSAITFTTVGYGDLIPKPIGAFRLLAASEAFMGVFLTGLFIFTLARKYSAR